MLLNEAYRNVTIQDRNGPLTLSVAQAAMRSLALKAAQSNVGAQKLLLQNLHHAESEKTNELHTLFEAVIQYKQQTYAAIANSEKYGIPLKEELLPHPVHVITDMRMCEVRFIGPIDRKDKERWDELWAFKAGFEAELKRLKKQLKKQPDSQMLKDDIAEAQYCLELTERAIIIKWHRPVSEVITDPHRHSETQYRIENDIMNTEMARLVDCLKFYTLQDKDDAWIKAYTLIKYEADVWNLSIFQITALAISFESVINL